MLASVAMHANTPPYATTLRDECQTLLDGTVLRLPYLRMASVSTADGRPFALAVSHSAPDSNRIAAMSSSLLALSESFSREVLRSPCRYSLISTEHGVVATVRVPSAKRMHALAIATDDSEMLAMVLRNALDVADRIAEILDQPSH